MKTVPKPLSYVIFFGLLLLCSCETDSRPHAQVSTAGSVPRGKEQPFLKEDLVRPPLPADVPLNKGAGRGGDIIVPIRLATGKELLFALDTGSPMTFFDKSLEMELGKRVGTTTIFSVAKGELKSDFYTAPNLYLGKTRLVIGKYVATLDEKQISALYANKSVLVDSGKRIMGILGMDCLRHYCLQLDFAAGEMRFLDSDHLSDAELGKTFRLAFCGSSPVYIRPFLHHCGFMGESSNILIDTGCNIDGLVPEGTFNGNGVLLTRPVWNGDTYSNLVIAAAGHASSIGLSFLARHLVTFDFPKRVMHLKQIRSGPLAGNIALEIRQSKYRTTLEAYESLMTKGQLPGLSKGDQGVAYLETPSHPKSELVTFGFQKVGDSYIYYYQVIKPSKDGSWRLQKSWRVDRNGHTVEEYSVH